MLDSLRLELSSAIAEFHKSRPSLSNHPNRQTGAGVLNEGLPGSKKLTRTLLTVDMTATSGLAHSYNSGAHAIRIGFPPHDLYGYDLYGYDSYGYNAFALNQTFRASATADGLSLEQKVVGEQATNVTRGFES